MDLLFYIAYHILIKRKNIKRRTKVRLSVDIVSISVKNIFKLPTNEAIANSLRPYEKTKLVLGKFGRNTEILAD